MPNFNKLQTFHDGILDSDKKFRALVENSLVGVYIIKDRKFTYVNQKLADIFGYSRQELLTKGPLDLTHDDDKFNVNTNVQKRITGITESIEYSFKGITKDGNIKYLRVFGSAITYEGEKVIIGSLIDETEIILAKKELESLARHDSLTTLYNRHVFETELQRTAQNSLRNKTKFALIIFDIDNFKRFNDSLGHHVGDIILKTISKRLKNVIRATNLLARIGGDEFAIIIESFQDKSEIATLVKRLKNAMNNAIVVDKHNLHVSMSIGVAFFPEHTKDPSTLQKLADMALYEVKSLGKNGYAIYSPQKDTIRKNLQLEDEIYQAIQNEEFEAYYQPQIDIQTDKITGAETLIRWNHPKDGLLSPALFLTLANEMGVLYKLDLFMLENALKKVRIWQKEDKNITLSVNISNSLFHHHKFLQTIQNLYKEYKDICHLLELEITEDIIINSQSYADDTLKKLKQFGFKLSIDDFGTGYSSLSHLKKMHIDKLKIDRLFIKDLATDTNDIAITKAIIAMGHALHLDVIAEGAEEKKQIDILKSMGCDMAQCFYYSKPLPLDRFEKEWLPKV